MIYLFHGSDVGRTRAKAFQWVAAARTKAPDAAYVRLTSDHITTEALAHAMSAQGLFFSRTLILLDDPFADTDAGETVLSLLSELAASENPVALLAPKLLAARVKKIEAVATKTFRTDAVAKTERGFNTALVNALAAKDGPALWKELVKAARAGDAPEATHGLLHWKARDLMQKGGRGWNTSEARALSVSLIELVSDSRSGDLPLQMALERFALALR